LNSNIFKFKYFYLITELPLGRRRLLHGYWLAGAAACPAVAWLWLAAAWPGGSTLPAACCCQQVSTMI